MGLSYAQDENTKVTEFYYSLQPMALQQLELYRSLPKIKTDSPDRRRSGEALLKQTLYQITYSIVRCMEPLIVGGLVDGEQIFKVQLENCQRQIPRVILLSGRGKNPECELQARLREEELKFPPFDFLVTEGVELRLFDLQKLADCPPVQ